MQDLEDWIPWTHTMRSEGQGCFFGIVERTTEVLVGETVMGIWKRGHRHGSFGLIIWDKAFWNKGLTSETVHLMLKFGFQTLNLFSIMLGVNAFNPRVRHVYQKAGFREVGRVREDIFFNGQYHDLIYMDILATEVQV
jgi:RimJ/RimL family protein N-acetyltransferase